MKRWIFTWAGNVSRKKVLFVIFGLHIFFARVTHLDPSQLTEFCALFLHILGDQDVCLVFVQFFFEKACDVSVSVLFSFFAIFFMNHSTFTSACIGPFTFADFKILYYNIEGGFKWLLWKEFLRFTQSFDTTQPPRASQSCAWLFLKFSVFQSFVKRCMSGARRCGLNGLRFTWAYIPFDEKRIATAKRK